MMKLKELIEYLEKKDSDTVVPMGFYQSHSYAGDYRCLAFIPKKDMTVGEMLEWTKCAIGIIYQWRGGEYKMVDSADVYIVGECGEIGEKISTILLDYMTGVYEGEECKSLRGVISKSTDEIAGLIADRDHVRTDLASADDELFEYRKKIVEQSKTIHDLIVEKDNVGQKLTWANREIPMLKDTIKEDRRRLDSLIVERNELNRGFINDRDTLRSIERTYAELVMCGLPLPDKDVQAIKSMESISNIMGGWDSTIGQEKEVVGRIRRNNLIIERDEARYILSLEKKESERLMNTIRAKDDKITSLEHELSIRNIPIMKESLKSSTRLALRQDDKITALESELAGFKEVSKVFMKVVNVIRDWEKDQNAGRVDRNAIHKIHGILEDYIPLPEITVVFGHGGSGYVRYSDTNDEKDKV